jgi:hypothetical protein
MNEFFVKNKESFIKVIVTILISVPIIYLGIYLTSLLVYKPETIAQSDISKSNNALGKMHYIDIAGISSAIWVDERNILLLTKATESNYSIYKYNLESREKVLVKEEEFQNIESDANKGNSENGKLNNGVRLGKLDDKIVICSWSHPRRNNETDTATVIEVIDFYSEELIHTINLLRYVKVDQCNDNLMLSEGDINLEKFDLVYSIAQNDYVQDITLAGFQITGVNETIVRKGSEESFRLDLPNKYIEVIANTEESRFLLIDIESKGLIYIKQ